MPGKAALDTNIIIALFAGEAAVAQRLLLYEVFVPSTVLGELYFGAMKSANAASNLSRVAEFAQAVEVLISDTETARNYGQIKADLRAHGRPIPENDIWIAAVCQQHGLVLVTRDAHFREIGGFPVESW